jgi:hypothetical protein
MRGGDRSNNHKKLMSNISKEDYATSLALIKQQMLKLTDESESIFSTKQDKSIIENEIDDLYRLGMKIREEKTGIQSLKQRQKNLYINNVDGSHIAELREIENKIKEIEKENDKRKQSYNTVVRLHAARKHQAQIKKGNEWDNIETRPRNRMGITRKSTVY